MPTILAPIMLWTSLIWADGTSNRRLYQMSSIAQCLGMAAAFVAQSPSDFGAASIAAGCVVSPGLRAS
jgi:hypothetical protein